MKLRIIAILVFFGLAAGAVETVGEKSHTAANKASDKIKRGSRKAADEICQMVDGKMNCLGKRIKHRAKDASDRAKTESQDVKNKID